MDGTAPGALHGECRRRGRELRAPHEVGEVDRAGRRAFELGDQSTAERVAGARRVDGFDRQSGDERVAAPRAH